MNRFNRVGLYWSKVKLEQVDNGNRLWIKLCHCQPNAEEFPFGGIITIFGKVFNTYSMWFLRILWHIASTVGCRGMAYFQILPLKENMCPSQTIISWEYGSWLQNDHQILNTALDGLFSLQLTLRMEIQIRVSLIHYILELRILLFTHHNISWITQFSMDTMLMLMR